MAIGDLLAQITGEPSPTASNFAPSPKPKSEEDARRPLDKPRPLTSQPGSSSTHTADARRPSVGYSKPKVNANGNRRASVTTFNNGQPTPPPSNDAPKPPPKKGSYAEIMARGQAAQKVLGQVGKIQHKKIEKLPSRREREEMRLQRAGKIQKGMAPKSKFQKIGQSSPQDGKTSAKKRAKAEELMPEKKVKKAALATTGYAGTARPKPGGPMRPRFGSSSRRLDRYDDRDGSSSRRPTYTDDEEDEAGEEDEVDYESDVSSDMEAAAFEVDEEEATAEKIAKREDAEALAEENRLKREKEEKKRRLMAMAKKAKPMSY